MQASKGGGGVGEDEVLELPLGSQAWIPSSATQLNIRYPPEHAGDLRVAYLPVTVSSTAPAEFQLDWDATVRVKAAWSQVERRGALRNQPGGGGDENEQKIVLPESGDGAASSDGDLMKLDQCNTASCVAYVCKRLVQEKPSTRLTSNTQLWVNPMNLRSGGGAGASNDVRRLQRPLEASLDGEPLFSAKTFCHDSLYPFFEASRRALMETKAPQSIIFRGYCGSGKTEALKAGLQYLLFSSSASPSSRRSSIARRPSIPQPSGSLTEAAYERLGSRLNPIIHNSATPQSQLVSKRVAASIAIFDAFLTAPSSSNSRHTHSSRSLRRCRVKVDVENAAVVGIEATAAILDTSRFRTRSPSQKAFNIFPIILSFLAKEAPSLLQEHNPGEESMASYLPSSEADQASAAADGAYLRHVLREAGLRDGQWDDACRALLAIVVIQSTVIVGNETAVLPSASRPAIASVEALLGAPNDSLSELLLRKSDPMNPKLGMIDNSPAESRIVMDQLCAAIFNALLTFITTACCERSIIESSVTYSAPEFVGISYVELLELPGFESFDAAQPGALSALAYNYVDERLLPYFLASSLAKELDKYTAEGIAPPSVSQPNVQTFVDLLDKPNTTLGGSKVPPGIISTLEETCQGMRPDDKSFCEKLLANHSKSKLVRGAGHKAKMTQFSVRHFFGDASYDAEGWIQQNKARITDAIASFVTSCSIASFIKEQAAEGEEAAPTAKVPGRGGDKAVLAKNMYLTKCRDTMTKLLASLDSPTGSVTSFILCVRPSEQALPGRSAYDSSFMALQLRHLLAPVLAQVNLVGFPVQIEFAEFYDAFRAAVPFSEEGLPASRRDKKAPVPPELVEKLIDALYVAVEKLRPCNYGAATVDLIRKSPLKPTVGTRRVFLSLEGEHLFRALLAHTDALFGRAASLIQSGARTKLAGRRWVAMKQAILLLQKHGRRFIHSRRLAVARKAIVLIQRQIRRFVPLRRFRALVGATAVVKRRLKKGGMLLRLRFLKLSRSVKVFQNLAKGLPMKQRIASVLHAVLILQAASQRFLRRLRIHIKCRHAAVAIQRVARGRVCRKLNARKIYALTMRKRQRIGVRCVRQLQGAFRSRGVKRRFRRLVACTRILQRWFCARLLRNRFLKVVCLVHFLQSHTRRRVAANHVTLIMAAKMLALEQDRLVSVREAEVAAALSLPPAIYPPPSASGLTGSEPTLSSVGVVELSAVPLQSRTTGNQMLHTICRRHVLSFDVGCDLGESYPGGWLAPVMALQGSLVAAKTSISQIATGAHFTIIVDSTNNIHAMGLADSGQFGNGDKGKRSLSTPAIMNHCTSAIARDELMHSKKVQAAYDPLGHRMPHPSRGGAIAAPAVVAQISCGRDHTLLLTATGLVWAWGGNKKGQCGTRGFDAVFRPSIVCASASASASAASHSNGPGAAGGVPVLVPLQCVKKIVTASYASGCLVDSGVLYTWGAADCLGRPAVSAGAGNDRGKGNPNISLKDCPEPSPVPFFSLGGSSLGKLTVHAVEFGDAHCVALASSSLKGYSMRESCDVFSWGSNVCGQLGVGEVALKSSAKPLRVRLPFELGHYDRVNSVGGAGASSGMAGARERDRGQAGIHISSGGRHTLLLVRGSLWAWGWNAFGQCGRLPAGPGEHLFSPVAIAIHKPPALDRNTRSRESWIGSIPDQRSCRAAATLLVGGGTAATANWSMGGVSHDGSSGGSGGAGAGAGGSSCSTRLGVVVAVSAGWRHSCCLTDSGVAFVWGRIAPVSPFFSTDPIESESASGAAQSSSQGLGQGLGQGQGFAKGGRNPTTAAITAPGEIQSLKAGASRKFALLAPSLMSVPISQHGFVSGLWTTTGGSVLALGVEVVDYDLWTGPLAQAHVAGSRLGHYSVDVSSGSGSGKVSSASTAASAKANGKENAGGLRNSRASSSTAAPAFAAANGAAISAGAGGAPALSSVDITSKAYLKKVSQPRLSGPCSVHALTPRGVGGAGADAVGGVGAGAVTGTGVESAAPPLGNYITSSSPIVPSDTSRSFNTGFRPIAVGASASNVHSEFRKRLGGFKVSTFLREGNNAGTGGGDGRKREKNDVQSSSRSPRALVTPAAPAAPAAPAPPAPAPALMPLGPQSAHKKLQMAARRRSSIDMAGEGGEGEGEGRGGAIMSTAAAAAAIGSSELFPPPPPRPPPPADPAPKRPTNPTAKAIPVAAALTGKPTSDGLMALIAPPAPPARPIGYELTSSAYFDALKGGGGGGASPRAGVGMPLADKKASLRRLQKRNSTSGANPSQYIVAVSQAATFSDVQRVADAAFEGQEAADGLRERQTRAAAEARRASMPSLSSSLLSNSPSPAQLLYGDSGAGAGAGAGRAGAGFSPSSRLRSKPGTEIVDDLLSSVRTEISSIRSAFSSSSSSSSSAAPSASAGALSAFARRARGGGGNGSPSQKPALPLQGSIPSDVSFYGFPQSLPPPSTLPPQPQFRPAGKRKPPPGPPPTSHKGGSSQGVGGNGPRPPAMAPTAMHELAFLISSIRSEDI